MNKPIGFVLLSGGIDSSTALAYALRDCQDVTAISIDYGQRHLKEIEAAKKVADHFNIRHETHQILGIPKVMLTDKDAVVPNVSYNDLPEGVSPTYVPFRNGQLLSKIAGIAQHRIGIARDKDSYASTPSDIKGLIYIGTHAEDAANDAYPDCRLDFIGAMGAAIYIGTYHQVELRAPLIQMNKQEIIRAGYELNVPYHLTWSCYKGEEIHCGVCPTCRARREGFEKAGVSDPTVYNKRSDDDDIPF